MPEHTDTRPTVPSHRRPGPPCGGWSAWHLHLPAFDHRRMDRVLTDVVAPSLAGLAGVAPAPAWFVVRYWQGGPHIRLRVRDLDAGAAARLGEGLRLAFERSGVGAVGPDDRPLDDREYEAMVAGVARAGEGSGPLDVPSLRPPGVHEAVYVPETARYGGPAALAVSEDLFWRASRWVVTFLGHRPDDASRAGVALRATALAVSTALAPGERGRALHVATSSWREWAGTPDGEPGAGTPDGEPGANAAWVAARADGLRERGGLAALASPRGLGPLRPWVDGLVAAVPGWRETAVGSAGILWSHLHMVHNRLGVSIEDEAAHYAVLDALDPVSP
jgi:hypothetical protein